MPREWNGYVRQTKGRSTWQAKWKEHGTERWLVTRGFESKAHANDFLTEKRREYRMRARGDWNEFAKPRRQPIAEHVAAFHGHILANRRRREGKRSEKHANLTKARLTKAFAKMKVRTLADLDGAAVDRFLGKLLDQRRAIKTRNAYAAVFKQFTGWAVSDERLERDPLGNVRFLDATAAMKRKQTLTWEKVRELAAAGPQRLLQKTRGPKTAAKHFEVARRRSLIIVTMFLTGLRNRELASLQWGWIDFVERIVTLPHTVTKSGCTEHLPLHKGLKELLEQERARRSQRLGRPVKDSELVVGELVNGEPQLPRWIVEQLRKDAKWIKLPEIDEQGRKLVLYSMRTSFATALDAAGVMKEIRSRLMRHRTSDVTELHYVQREHAVLLAAIDMIPAEAAEVPGLWIGAPRKDPRPLSTVEDGCAPSTKTGTS